MSESIQGCIQDFFVWGGGEISHIFCTYVYCVYVVYIIIMPGILGGGEIPVHPPPPPPPSVCNPGIIVQKHGGEGGSTG